MTWNATGIMSSCSYLCDTLNEHSIDICGIAEHWLYEQDLHFLNSIDNMYCSHAVSDYGLLLPSNRKVGKGGVCILWKRNLNNMITPLDIDDDRIIGIKLQINPENIIFIFQVYLPCTNHGTEVFKGYLEKIENLFFSFSQKGLVIVMGDLNAEVNPKTKRNSCFSELLKRNNILSLNGTMLGNISTNISYNGSIGTTIDHVLIPSEKIDLFITCNIPEDSALNVSSHRPIICTLSLPIFNFASPINEKSGHINWSKVSRENIDKYQAFLLSNTQCAIELDRDILCISQIDGLYDFIVSLVNAANNNCFPSSKFKHFLKPYWDDELKSACKMSKVKRRVWILSGKPRGKEYLTYVEYKDAKRVLRKLHRNKVLQYISTLHEEIDRYAEIDSKLFWKCINRRRNKSRATVGNELVFNDMVYRDPLLINENWAQYFKELYTPTENDDFKNSNRLHIKEELDNISEYISTLTFNDNDILVSPEEVKNACDKAKRNKACGPDGCFYENFKFGGIIMYKLCAKLFTAMLKFSHCPVDMNKGDIIVLHKGGNKSHNDPNNYRAITLSSVILKLYESVILSRMKQCSYALNDLQGGFREGMGCLMTSFLFRECNNYVCENGSKLYTCFLDVRQAFDRVWHEALMVKLYNTNIDIPLYKAICNLYQNMQSRVRSNGFISSWFPILQGTRQGGVISPQLYLVFINDLLNKLVCSQYGLTVYGLNCTCPTSADDMVLLSLSKTGLQELMDICLEYSCTYRYTYNAKKSSVIVTNEKSSRNKLSGDQRWLLGNDTVNEHDSYTHLGVLFIKNGELSQVVKECSSKIRKTFLGIVNYGIYENGIHPISAKHLYETIVLPKALYGCELWSDLSKDEILSLEIAHRFCLKLIQGLPKSSRSDIVLTTLGMLPIEAEIDKRKLVFLGQLCRIENDNVVKKLFNYRLCYYFNNCSKVSGFIPDIHRICGKYGLAEVLEKYYRTGVFPAKSVWKRTVNSNIKIKHVSLVKSSILSDNMLQEYALIQSLTEIRPCQLWLLSKSHRNFLQYSQAAVKFTHLLFVRPYTSRCRRCDKLTDEFALHMAMYCECTVSTRNILWKKIYRTYGNEMFKQLILYSPRLQLIHLLSGLRHFRFSDADTVCLQIVGSFCLNILSRV